MRACVCDQVGGRLVFFLPCHPSVSSVSGLLPRHACLAVTDTSCQRLNANLNRWLVTMTKVRCRYGLNQPYLSVIELGLDM